MGRSVADFFLGSVGTGSEAMRAVGHHRTIKKSATEPPSSMCVEVCKKQL